MVAEVEIRLNKGAQEQFFRSEAAFPAFLGGFRSGKTAAAVNRCWKYSVVDHPGSVGVWTEPVAAMFAEVLLPTLRKFFGEYEGALWQETGKGGPNHRILFANGSVWLLKAAETPERLVGFEAAWALMDEAASTEHGSQKDAYLMLVGRLSQQGFPHWLGITSTPGGYNWIWKEWIEAPDAKETGHILFTGSSLDNPYLEESYKNRLKQTYVEGTPMYRQYVLGESVQLEGLVLPNFDPDKHTAPWPWRPYERRSHEDWQEALKRGNQNAGDKSGVLFIRKIAGVDFGVQSPTAIVECAVTQSGHRYLKEWLYKRDCDDETFVRACRDAMEDGITLFVCDPSGKDRIKWMNDKGIPSVKARSNRIEARVKAWSTPLGQGMLTVCNESQFLIREIMGLSWAKRRGRELETDKFDVNTPDHGFDSGSYSLLEIDAMPIGWKVPELVELL